MRDEDLLGFVCEDNNDVMWFEMLDSFGIIFTTCENELEENLEICELSPDIFKA